MQTKNELPTTAAISPWILALGVSALLAGHLEAQTYTVIDLTPTTPYNAAQSVSGGVAAGFTAPSFSGSFTRATLWDAEGAIDLHPAFVDDASTGAAGRSSVQGMGGLFQAGWGAGPGTANRSVPVRWSGTAESATALSIPFANLGGQARATDGFQIVGFATPSKSDGTTAGAIRALLWDAATGTATDLGDGGGKGAQALGVGGGKQVGYAFKGAANAAYWTGSSRSLVLLHPKAAVASQAYATDGIREVGYSSYDVRIRVEAVGGAKNAIRDYATVWTDTSVSAQNIHPYPVNAAPGVAFTISYATGVAGPWIAGWAADFAKTGTPAYYHAIVWDVSLQSIDLNAFLPAGFSGAQAFSVDADGNVAGVMISTSGERHAALWVLQPAP